MSVTVGSGRNVAKYNLPVALFCYHSHFFRQETLRYDAVGARLGSNKKKRKLTPEVETTTVQIKNEDRESPAETVSSNNSWRNKDEAVVQLPEVDPSIFGLFLKYVYTGYYPAAVDARPETARSIPRTTMSTQPDIPYIPARASMPPPASINSRQAPPDGQLP